MHTTEIHQNNTAGFAARAIAGIRALFGEKRTLTGAFAAACANDIRGQHGLAIRVASLSRLSRRERTAWLVQAAVAFRGEWATVGIADTLSRMAKRPVLFRAVLSALNVAPAENMTTFPTPFWIAQAA